MSGTSSILRFATPLLWRSLKKHLLNFIRPNFHSVFKINNPLGLKLLTRLRIGFSHLKEHEFKHNSQDSVDPLCTCGNDIESTFHFFLHFPNFTTQRQTLLNKLKSLNASIMAENESSIVRTILFGRPDFNYLTNKEIINATISFILTTKRFNCPFFKINQFIEVWSASISPLYIFSLYFFLFNILIFIPGAVVSLSWISLYVC